eukprot:g24903.t1
MTPKPTESVAECVAGAGRTATSPPVPAELVSELPAAGWISHVGKGGRVSWHHKSLGPAPWERQPETDELDLARAPDDQLPDTNPFSDAFEEAPAASRSAPVLPRQGYGTPSTSASPHGRFLAQPCLETRTSSTPHGCSDGAGTPARADLREVRAATVPDFLHKGCLRAEVERLTTGVQGWKTHDSRSLLITGSQLLIYEKGSMDQVKTVVNLLEDVERCSLLSSGILSLEPPEELEKHRAEGDLWVALHGHIYDMSEYVWEHPGGSSAIFDVGGLDGTETFEAVHNKERRFNSNSGRRKHFGWKLLADMKKTEQKSSSSLSLSCQVPPPKALPSTSKKAIIIQEPEKPSPPPSLLVEEDPVQDLDEINEQMDLAATQAKAKGHVPRGSVYKPLPGLPFSSGTPIEESSTQRTLDSLLLKRTLGFANEDTQLQKLTLEVRALKDRLSRASWTGRFKRGMSTASDLFRSSPAASHGRLTSS